MNIKSIKISAPGKLIVSGEHSILYGYPCISMAIDKTIKVDISQRIDKNVYIKSKQFGDVFFQLNEKQNVKDWCKSSQFLCNKLSKYGLDININSNIPTGCGTSGALFATLSCGLLLLNNENLSLNDLLKQTLKLYFEFHKNKQYQSGIDVITSIRGGVIYYNPKTKNVRNINYDFLKKLNISAIYSGYKTPTIETIKIANKVKNSKKIYSEISEITKKILYEIEKEKDFKKFQHYIKLNNECLRKLNLCGNDENNILTQCDKNDICAKISGSGLGDYIISFSTKDFKIKKYDKINIKIAKNGIKTNIKKTFFAPINIALIKYWGKRDIEKNLPMSSSISMTSTKLGTTTNIEKSNKNILIFNNKKIEEGSDFFKKTFNYIETFKKETCIKKNDNTKFKIITKNNIPTASGLASSASCFASLTFTLNSFYNLNLSEVEMSKIARLGSGSACRSVFENSKFVKWNKGNDNNGADCFAEKIILNKNDFKNKIEMLILVLSNKKKKTSSRDAMIMTQKKSKIYQQWLKQTTKDFENFNKISNFREFGKMVENNSMLMHKSINEIGIIFFNNKTYKVIDFVKSEREKNIQIYFTIDAGANVVLLFEKQNKEKILNSLLKTKIVSQKNILEF